MSSSILHITTVHPAFDIRIFHKECKSLAKFGYDVTLLCQHDANESVDGVNIVALPSIKNRFERMLKLNWKALLYAFKSDVRVLHLHDPELIILGMMMKMLGRTVIYDVHEDTPRDIISKSWIFKPFRHVIAKGFEWLEHYAANGFDLIICATPHIQERFVDQARKVTCIKNYPSIDEITPAAGWEHKERAVCYVGIINLTKGLKTMLEAMDLTHNISLLLGGDFSYESEYEAMQQLPGWEKTEILGNLDRKQVVHTLHRAMAGLVLLHPEGNFIHSLPHKMFEYMSAGIPVIASNFPLFQQIIEDDECGFCVDPCNPKEIGMAIQWMVEHPQQAEEMGQRGRKVIEEKYSWSQEALKLHESVEELMLHVRD